MFPDILHLPWLFHPILVRLTIGLANLTHHDLDNRSECLHLLLYGATLYTVPEACTVANVACAACLSRKKLCQTLCEVKRMCDRVDCSAERL